MIHNKGVNNKGDYDSGDSLSRNSHVWREKKMNDKDIITDCCETIYNVCNAQCELKFMDHMTMDVVAGAIDTINRTLLERDSRIIKEVMKLKDEEIIQQNKDGDTDNHMKCVRMLNYIMELVKGD